MVHTFMMDGMYFAVDVYSGAIHILDETAYRLLQQMSDGGCFSDQTFSQGLNEEQRQAFEELKALYEQKLLFSEDSYREFADHWHKQSVVKAMCLHIAHDCNLRCKYCFADTGAFSHERSLMSEEVGKKAIDFVIRNSGNRRNIEIDFFGGEPLMNFEVVKKIVAYADEQGAKHGKNFRYTITTNGILLDDEKMDYINQHMSNVVLSIDGRKEVNDENRKSPNGKGCYDVIVPKFQKIAQQRGQDNYYVRGTFTAENLDFAEDVLHLADLGFKQVSVEPVVELEEKSYALRESDLEQIFAEYERLAKEYVKRRKEGNGFNFFHFMMDLEQSPCAIKRLSGCGAGHEYVAVTPDGSIYPCHQLAEVERWKMGTVEDEHLAEDKRKMFENNHIYTKPDCIDCWAKFYCSGGCPANAVKFNGDITKPYQLGCEMQRKRFECAIYAAACLED